LPGIPVNVDWQEFPGNLEVCQCPVSLEMGGERGRLPALSLALPQPYQWQCNSVIV